MFKRLSDSLRAVAFELKELRQAREYDIQAAFNGLNNKLDQIIMTQTELAAGLKAIQTQVGKVAAEQAARFDVLTAKIVELEALIGTGGAIGTEVTDALAAVQTALQALDDVIPDAPPAPTP